MEDFINSFPYTYYRIGIRYIIAAGIAFMLFYVIFRNQRIFKKIQTKFPKHTDYFRDLTYSLVTIAIFTVIAHWSFVTLRTSNILIYDLEAKSGWYWLMTVVPIFIIHDFYFYWAHRLMHHPKIFRTVHKVHHLSTNPSPWTAYAFHPFEAVIETLIIPILVFTVPTHPWIIVLFMIFRSFIMSMVISDLRYFPEGFTKPK